MKRNINLISDTVTLQPLSMREAMFNAQVGDDVYHDDPTINQLEALASEITGKEAAAFVCSGTMGNQLSIMTHTNRGDQILLGYKAHISVHEVGAPAVLSGVNQKQIFNLDTKIYPTDIIDNCTNHNDIHVPYTTLLCLENSLANGNVVSLQEMQALYQCAKANNLKVHLDGARIFNAALALNCSVKDLAQYCDSMMFCLSKGLCAPVGSMVVGSKEFISKLKKNRKMIGGGLRQAGYLAACGIIAINDMSKRLIDDHNNAQLLAKGLSEIEAININLDQVVTNMVYFKVNDQNFDYSALNNYLNINGIKTGGYEDKSYRLVTHYGIEKEDVDYTVQVFKEYFK